MASAQKSPVVLTLRMLVGAVVGALFLMAVALMFVLGFGAPPLWAVLLLLLIGVAVYAVLQSFGYRVKPVSPSLPPEQARDAAMNAFRSTLMLRLTLAESVAIIGIALAFVAGRTVLLYDLGAAISVLLLAVHVWPSLRTVDRVVAGLEADGARTGLREVLGFGGGAQDGPVTRLG
ncbi:MAG TPA: hypothetical protein VNS83_06600 [Lapillicoccus sp.]|nr:hypothetical protein [Lapillicoccus sp.]